MLALAAQAACKNYEDVEPADICDDVGYAISSRTFSCEKSERLANERFHRFRDQVPCNVTKETMSFDCSVSIEALTCEQQAPLGDDFSLWLASPSCQALLGSGLPAAPPPLQGNCAPFREAVIAKATECRIPGEPLPTVMVNLSNCSEALAQQHQEACLAQLNAILACETVYRYAAGVDQWTEAPVCQSVIAGIAP